MFAPFALPSKLLDNLIASNPCANKAPIVTFRHLAVWFWDRLASTRTWGVRVVEGEWHMFDVVRIRGLKSLRVVWVLGQAGCSRRRVSGLLVHLFLCGLHHVRHVWIVRVRHIRLGLVGERHRADICVGVKRGVRWVYWVRGGQGS